MMTDETIAMKVSRVAFASTVLLLASTAQTADTGSVTQVTQSLEQISAEVQGVLAQEKINNAFDLFKRLSAHGITWQPSLLAPNNLAERLNDEQLRMYAGIKLFDALYAATFKQRKAVAEAVAVIEDVQDKLDLRAEADLSSALFTTLKRAAADPHGIDLDKTFGHLAASYIQDVPVLMANPRSAEYLVDSLFGLTIQQAYMRGKFHNALHDAGDFALDKGAQGQPDRGEWEEVMLTLLKVAAPVDKTLTVNGRTIAKADLIAKMHAAYRADTTPEETYAIQAQWTEVNKEVAATRAAILTPAR